MRNSGCMENQDLVWDLDNFGKQKQARKFVMGFENKLCVFSQSVEQLYTNYSIFFPEEENRRLVILPNPYAHHDTFHGVVESAVSPTGLFVMPANPKDQLGRLNLALPIKGGENQKHRMVPLEVGLRLINSKRPANRPFLPVLMKGDLRELDRTTPCLHLHSVNLAKLAISGLETNDIQKVILNNLEDLAKRQ